MIHEECSSAKVRNVDLCWLVMKNCIFYFYTYAFYNTLSIIYYSYHVKGSKLL